MSLTRRAFVAACAAVIAGGSAATARAVPMLHYHQLSTPYKKHGQWEYALGSDCWHARLRDEVYMPDTGRNAKLPNTLSITWWYDSLARMGWECQSFTMASIVNEDGSYTGFMSIRVHALERNRHQYWIPNVSTWDGYPAPRNCWIA